jgi:hypothetical protein
MSQPPIPHIRYSWRLPLLISLLLHTGLVLPFCFQAFQAGGDYANGIAIDTVVLGPETAATLSLDDAPQPHKPKPPAPAILPSDPTPPSLASSKAISTTPPSLVVSLPPPQTESAEAQEEPVTTANARGGLGGTKAGARHGQGTTSFFNIEVEARSIVYLIDRSASMGQDGSFDAAKRELRTSLEQLPESAGFQVIAYNRSAEPLLISGRADLVAATPENKSRAAFLLEQLYAEGGTEHVRALRRALALQPDVIFFFTDGDGLSAEQVRTITLFNHGRSILHAIEPAAGPESGRGTQPLRLLVEQNRGLYRRALRAP